MLTDVAKAAGLKTIATNDFTTLSARGRAPRTTCCARTVPAFNDANRMRL